jgi:hypothetical protein
VWGGGGGGRDILKFVIHESWVLYIFIFTIDSLTELRNTERRMTQLTVAERRTNERRI